jgi:hypothetical protein
MQILQHEMPPNQNDNVTPTHLLIGLKKVLGGSIPKLSSSKAKFYICWTIMDF